MSHTDPSDSSSEDESHQSTTFHKRRKLEAGNKDLTSPFDPSKEKETEEFRFRAPNVVNSYMEKHFRRTLSKEERTAMLRVHPKPDTPVASPPKLDQFMSDFAGKRLDKARDTQLIKIQTNLLYAANPLAKLWSEVVEQGLDQDPKALIPIADVLNTIQRALVLLGSANNTISETYWWMRILYTGVRYVYLLCGYY